jgi:7-cyano-7-deazaguanine synthase
MSEKPVVEILWTGGFDSTFRVCQLSRRDVIIRPYYMAADRDCIENELQAVRSITEKLRENEATKAVIEDVIFVKMDERKEDQKVVDAFQRLIQKDYMGAQYEYLGVFAEEHKGIELSIHRDDKAMTYIKKYDALKKAEDAIGDRYVVDPEKSSEDCVTVFGNMSFALVDYTKLQMKKEYEKMGLADIIDMTWFCHAPVNGEPCGCCNCCIYTIEEGMKYRFSKEALKRYRRKKSVPRKIYRKIKSGVVHMVKAQ